ncbi:hypothetical protein J2850_004282 [Azospirillum picis]|uniref:Uncharacterized protein n=1 Tax=Azospirillum picis TaxID=488438 RepID=A0ABU0MPI7_9PROT|nr:hypothetical protein [Azospirillum picis]MDQ0535393.1 hypothetical protein [Azospirillum picis]
MLDILGEFLCHLAIWSPLLLWAVLGLWWEHRQNKGS